MYAICLVGAWLIWHLMYRFRVVGRENLPSKGGFVMLCNHRSAADIIFLMLARFRFQKPLIFAKAELFQITPPLTWFFKYLGAVPISRGKGDTAVIDATVQKVRDGRDLLVFPEGTRTKTGHLGQLKSGAFVVAARAGADIVPCRIIYEAGRPRLFSRVTLAIGKPLAQQELGLSDADALSPAALRGAKSITVQRLKQLYAENAVSTGCPLPPPPAEQPAQTIPAEKVG